MAQLILENISIPMVEEVQGLDSTSWGAFALGGAGSQFDDVMNARIILERCMRTYLFSLSARVQIKFKSIL